MKMKIALFALFAFTAINAQNQGITGDINWFNNWTNFKPKSAEYDAPSRILTGVISENTTLKKGSYLLMGTVYVANKAILTIEPGAVLRGDFESNGTLVITRGCKIIAEGTVTDPIVFTSSKAALDRKPGDWGGVIIYGDAPLNRIGGVISSIYDSNPLYNLFGGNNVNDDSGSLKYVRIEFAGKKLNEKLMLNGLTLGAVGKKTKIEYVQVSLAKDDAFEIIGGEFDMNNIISFNNADDDFDFSMGTICTMSNSISIRSPFISDNTRSRCFEIDSYDKVENFDPSKKKTIIKLNNVVMVMNEEGNMSLVKEAVSLKAESFLEMNKCVIVGFSSFLALDDKYLADDNFKKIKIYNTTVDNCTEVITNETLFKADIATNWFTQPDKLVTVSKYGIMNLFKNNETKKKPDFRLK
ncbi:MAG: hypothetical protein V4670_05435 [Bacteroidota bacterium]